MSKQQAASKRYIVNDYAVIDAATQKQVFRGANAKEVAESLNQGFLQEFEQLQKTVKALIMPLIREHPLPWRVVDSGFGAEVQGSDGKSLAFCTDGNEGLFICRLARELEMEAER
jgi:hypothetical protein